jgi:single-strand selective monofunctional uracil DNA glycosylase
MVAPKETGMPKQLIRAAEWLNKGLAELEFAAPVERVLNPLVYAWAPHQIYLERFGGGSKKVLFLGMNPGPWGMAQTGIPFGEVAAVRDWMGISAAVERPVNEHPKRPVDGFECTRSEVSGRRLWGAVAERFADPADFFQDCFVANYCPLIFLEASGKNRTPDKLSAAERQAVEALCDEHLRRIVAILRPQWVIGVGRFAQKRAQRALGSDGPAIETVLHPSPASPAANRGWVAQARVQIEALGLSSPF